MGSRQQGYEAIDELIRDAQIERYVVLGDAIGAACAATWRAITSIGDPRQGEKA